MKSLKDTIEFKGTKDGFIIVINNEADYEEARKNLIDKINSNLFFFKGSQFCDIYATNLNEKEKLDLINFLKEKYNINFSKKEKAIINKLSSDTMYYNTNGEKPTKFIKNTIRSGAFVEYEGNIVVLGDVNPGAQLIADGNIVVMGVLRGIAHAGSKGDESAFVSAIKRNPIQLRISSVIAISPDDDTYSSNSLPQIAFVHDGQIVIENYPTKI